MDSLLRAIELADAGEWDASHRIVQGLDGVNACRLRANLHREEGDTGNANYGYRRAGKPFTDVPFTEERAAIQAAMETKPG